MFRKDSNFQFGFVFFFPFEKLLSQRTYWFFCWSLFPQVVRATKKDTGSVYALKIMDKKFIAKENKIAYVKLERIVLDQLDHPGIIRLFFTFQDTYSLCKCSYLAKLFPIYTSRPYMICWISC